MSMSFSTCAKASSNLKQGLKKLYTIPELCLIRLLKSNKAIMNESEIKISTSIMTVCHDCKK